MSKAAQGSSKVLVGPGHPAWPLEDGTNLIEMSNVLWFPGAGTVQFADNSVRPRSILQANRKILQKGHYLNDIPKLACATMTNSSPSCKPLAGIHEVLLWRLPNVNNLGHFLWDNLSELLFSLNHIGSRSAKQRMLVVNNERIEDTFAFGAGWVSLFPVMFSGGIRTMREMETEACYAVPRIVFGHGESMTSRPVSDQLRNFDVIKSAGFAAAGISAPPSLRRDARAWQSKRVVHMTRNDTRALQTTLGVEGSE